jgi:hypothetical protein
VLQSGQDHYSSFFCVRFGRSFFGSWKKKKKLVSCAPEGVMVLKVAAMAGLTGTGPFTISSRASSETAAGLGFSDVSMFAGCRLQGTLFLILLNNC